MAVNFLRASRRREGKREEVWKGRGRTRSPMPHISLQHLLSIIPRETYRELARARDNAAWRASSKNHDRDKSARDSPRPVSVTSQSLTLPLRNGGRR